MVPTMKIRRTLPVIILLFFVSPTFAGEADVIDVQVSKSDTKTYTFEVTISHKDTGWEHYANKWEILGGNEEILGTRILHHPHVNEQPFTRTLSGVEIPKSIKTVTIRAHDSEHGYGGKVVRVELP